MSTVMDVILVLEGTKITKEQLETTRLAKHINQLRRKTNNEMLARRLKNLLKKWREMVIPVIPSSTVPITMTTGTKTITTLKTGTSAPPPQSYLNQCMGKQNQSQAYKINCLPTNSQSSMLNGGRSTFAHSPNTKLNATIGSSSHSIASATLSALTTNASNAAAATAAAILRTNMVKSSVSTANKYQLSNNGGSSSSTSLSNTSKAAKAGPISFANLISQAEANQKNSGNSSQKSNLNKRTNNNLFFDDRSLSPLPKIPKLNKDSTNISIAASAAAERSSSPLYLFGDSIAHEPPKQLFRDEYSRGGDGSEIADILLDDSNSRKHFNGHSRIFQMSTPPCSSSLDVHSDGDSLSLTLPSADKSCSNTGKGSSSGALLNVANAISSKHKKHKKDKRQVREKSTVNIGDTNVRSMQSCPTAKSYVKKQQHTSEFDPSNSFSNDSNTFFNSTKHLTQTSTSILNSSQTIIKTMKNHYSSDLTFSGKFRKMEEDTIINVDSSSSSSSNEDDRSSSAIVAAAQPTRKVSTVLPNSGRASPLLKKQHHPSPTTHGERLLSPITKTLHFSRPNSPVLVHEGHSCSIENSNDSLTNSVRHVSVPTTPQLVPLAVGVCLSEDTVTGGESSSVPLQLQSSGTAFQQVADQPQKKRGRKKGSNGPDRRLTSGISEQLGLQQSEPVTLLGLKSKIDLMRGGQKKVKSTKELLADLQNRKPDDQFSATLSPKLISHLEHNVSSPISGSGE